MHVGAGPGLRGQPSSLPAAGPRGGVPGDQESGGKGLQQRTLIKGTHQRILFPQSVERVAVGDESILGEIALTNREVLLFGKGVGRTSLIVWFQDGSFQEFNYAVQVDLSLLQKALQEIHASIRAEMAPDRDAIVLRGLVPDISYSKAAENVANRYLEASGRRSSAGETLIGVPGEGTPEGGAQVSPPPETGNRALAGAVINLIRLEKLPRTMEERIQEAIQPLGGERVTIRRILRGQMPNDEEDVLVLEGTVPDQVSLLRILTVASRVFTGQKGSAENDITVLGDESGALTETQSGGGQGGGGSQSGSTGLGGGLSGLGGAGGGSSASGTALFNRVEANIARAKAIELADGRILSFIEVEDLPQVRVQIRLFQIDRSLLRTFDSDLLFQAADFNVRPGTPTVNNVLQSLSGNASNEFLIAGDRVLLDSILSILESEDIARTLSQPSLMVLSGEIASFQVGGQIPIPVSFAPAFGNAETPGTTPGVFNSVQFANFGIQLSIRPLVDQNDVITLDLIPQIVEPDAGLTQTIRDTTGTTPATIAFQTKALRTSARLQDGQSLLIGGLLQSQGSYGQTRTPGIASVPILGWFFQGFTRNDQDQELVILVNPVLVRDPLPDADLWVFPTTAELLAAAGLLPGKRIATQVDENPTAVVPKGQPLIQGRLDGASATPHDWAERPGESRASSSLHPQTKKE